MSNKQAASAGRKRKWLVWGGVAVLLAAVLGWWFRPLSPVKPKISKETTYFTEPVRDDGTIDYLAAMNDRLSEGVTPENNAFVGIAKTMPADAWENEEHRQFVFEKLGVDPPGADEPRVIGFKTFVDRHNLKLARLVQQKPTMVRRALQEAAGDELGISIEAIREWQKRHDRSADAEKPLAATQALETTNRLAGREDEYKLPGEPWRDEAYPRVAAWLQRIKPGLAKVAEAVEDPRWYAPLWAADRPAIFNALMPWLQNIRRTAHALAVRARRELARGRLRTAWTDLRTILRLGYYPAFDRQIINHLVGFSVRAVGYEAFEELCRSPEITPQIARNLRRELRSIRAMPSIAQAYGLGIRARMLDATLYIWQDPDATGSTLAGSDGYPGAEAARRLNMNPTLRKINDICDRLVSIVKTSDHGAFRKKSQRFNDLVTRLEDRSDWYGSWTGQAAMLAAPAGRQREMVSDAIGTQLIEVLVPSVRSQSHTKLQARMGRVLARVSVALAGYRSEHGVYPEQLADLAPDWLDEVPKDLFTDKPLHYQRKGPGHAVVYSVGPNMKDNGGKQGEGAKADDLAFRLKPAGVSAEQF
jgi:hypothetical protein